MRRIATLLTRTALAVLVGLAFVGCDSSPSSVNDFDIQPDFDVPNLVQLVLTGPGSSTQFTVDYQGLANPPEVQTDGNATLEVAEQSGSAENGSTTYTVTYDGSVSGVVEETVTVSAQAEGESFTQTFPLSISPFVVTRQFQNNFAPVVDYESRSYSASGGTTVSVSDEVAENSTGINSLQVTSTGSGSVAFNRRVNAATADRFTFLIRPDNTTDMTLTVAFTEETGSGTSTSEVQIPIDAGDEWVQYGIVLSTLGDFNPVDPRSGGNGPLTSVEFSTDGNATFFLDDIGFANGAQQVAEVENFEAETLEYSCITLGTSDDVADASNGYTSRVIDGSGCFGYNYDTLTAGADADVLSFRVNASAGDELFIFLESPDSESGFTFDNGVTIALPTSGWQQVEVPLVDLAGGNADISALQDPGLNNVGFESTQGSSSTFLIDDVVIRPGSN